VAEITPSRRGREEWRDEVAARPHIRELIESDEAIGPLADMALIAEAANRVRASWMIVALSQRE
jgi:hypothetical protein